MAEKIIDSLLANEFSVEINEAVATRWPPTVAWPPAS